MKNKKNSKIDAILGVILLFFGIFSLISFYFSNAPSNILWFCNNTTFVLGFAFLLRNKFWMSSQVIFGFIPQIVWSFDYISQFFFKKTFLHTVDYMFEASYPKLFYILSLHHILLIPIMLYGLYKFGYHQQAWIGSLAHGSAIWFASYFFANSESNINCVYTPCNPYLPIELYSLIWPIVYAITVITPTKFILEKIHTKI